MDYRIATSHPRDGGRGLTLLELLVGVALSLLVLGWAVPSFTGLVMNARRTAELNDFVTAVHLARSETIKRGQDVVLCKSADGLSCGGADVDWHDGWLVFPNPDRDDPPQPDPGEPRLRVHRPAPSLRITANRNAFVHRPFGSRATNGTVTFCDARGPVHARAVVVSYTGRPRTSETRPDGGPLVCD